MHRAGNRERIGLGADLPFSGVDIWNAWDLTWLDERGRPQAATAEIRIPADSPGIVESKSMKLYLGSFAMSEYASPDAVRDLIAADLGECVGAPVTVRVDTLDATQGRGLQNDPAPNHAHIAQRRHGRTVDENLEPAGVAGGEPEDRALGYGQAFACAQHPAQDDPPAGIAKLDPAVGLGPQGHALRCLGARRRRRRLEGPSGHGRRTGRRGCQTGRAGTGRRVERSGSGGWW